MDPGGHAGDELLAAVAASLSGRLAEITRDVTEHLAAGIEQLRGDTAILGVLRASVTENITAIFHVFEHGMPVETIEAPPAAIEYARRLAQRGVPAGALNCTVTRRFSARPGAVLLSAIGFSSPKPCAVRMPAATPCASR